MKILYRILMLLLWIPISAFLIFVHQFQHLLFGLGIDFDFNLENNYENN